MSKKRNLAVLMAAATVATSVAPVFAAQAEIKNQNVDEATLVAEVKKLLATKYTDETESGIKDLEVEESYQNSVFAIVANPSGTAFNKNTNIKSANQLSDLIEKARLKGETVSVQVTDKGHAEVDGKIVATEKSVYSFYADTDLADASSTFVIDEKFVDTTKTEPAVDGKVTLVPADEKVTIPLVGGTEIKLDVTDYKLDLAKPLDKDGNKLDLTGTSADSDAFKNIVGFEKLKNADDKETTKDLPSVLTAIYTVDASSTSVNYNISDLLTSEGYTATGAEFVNLMVDAQASGGTKVVKNGKEYIINTTSVDGVINAVGNGYEYAVTYTETVDGETTTFKVTISSSAADQAKLAQLRNDVINKAKVKVGNLVKYAGEDRFATAVEISKGAYKTNGSSDNTTRVAADAVVLVGQDAVVDGLAASPLAKKENAPILLSQKDSVPASTLAEIERTIGKEKTIFIVGGENTISKNVEKQLIDELNAKIVRISGSDRYDTSLEIAEKLQSSSNKAYVVGGNGEADAMSIAAVASQTGNISPIIVTPADGLNKATKAYFNDASTAVVVDVIGGTSTVSYDVLKDLNSLTKKVTDVNRISGSDRNDTNAKVIKEYFSNVDSVYVAKDGYVGGNGQLIDALAVAPIAAKDGAPIVLSTNELTDNQTKALKGAINTSKKTLVQVGEGTAATVIDSLLSLLKLK